VTLPSRIPAKIYTSLGHGEMQSLTFIFLYDSIDYEVIVPFNDVICSGFRITYLLMSKIANRTEFVVLVSSIVASALVYGFYHVVAPFI
jgi:hypothetical protein